MTTTGLGMASIFGKAHFPEHKNGQSKISVKMPLLLVHLLSLATSLDLLDTNHTQRVRCTYDLLIEESTQTGVPFAINHLQKDSEPMIRNLDCQVLILSSGTQ